MGIVSVFESPLERSRSGKYREPYRYTRTFYVRVDTPQEPLPHISLAPEVYYLDSHPDDQYALMQDFNCTVADDSGLYYKVTFVYYAPLNTETDPLVIPPDVWSASCSIMTGPCFLDKDNSPIVNAAGDPIEDLEKDFAEFRISLTKYYADLSWTGVAINYTNKVNASGWNNSPARTWKVHFQNATKHVETNEDGRLVYWETNWDFVHRGATWDLKPLNIGMMEKKDGKKQVIKVEGDPVTQPVPLNANGSANPTGTAAVINGGNGVRVYGEADFSIWGNPS